MDPSCIFWARAVRGSFFYGTEGTELSLVLLTLSSLPSISPLRFCSSSIWFLLHKHSSFLDSKKMPSHKKFQAPRLLFSDTLKSTFFSVLAGMTGPKYISTAKKREAALSWDLNHWIVMSLSQRSCVPLLSGLCYSIKGESVNVNYCWFWCFKKIYPQLCWGGAETKCVQKTISSQLEVSLSKGSSRCEELGQSCRLFSPKLGVRRAPNTQ